VGRRGGDNLLLRPLGLPSARAADDEVHGSSDPWGTCGSILRRFGPGGNRARLTSPPAEVVGR
jgi:hypothetical protein